MYYIIVVGAGNRGKAYAKHSRLRAVGVVDPDNEAKCEFAEMYKIPNDMQFVDVDDIPSLDELMGYRPEGGESVTERNIVVIVSTMDSLHLRCMESVVGKGYKRILLEKPMATNLADCRKLVKLVADNNVLCGVCHVLRSTYANRKIKSLLENKRAGRILSCRHLEPVGHIHYSHSFVRGNWHNEAASANFLLAKCCHDLDLIHWWFGDDDIVSIYSQGSLEYFNHENKPVEAGSATRCLDCKINKSCVYSCLHDKHHYRYSHERQESTNYGVCVFESDNDVMDNQLVLIKFRKGPLVNFQSVATTKDECQRSTEIYGSDGEIISRNPNTVIFTDFQTRESVTFSRDEDPEFDMDVGGVRLTGHGGADGLFIDQFLASLDKNELPITHPGVTIYSHMMAFTAERARKGMRVLKNEIF